MMDRAYKSLLPNEGLYFHIVAAGKSDSLSDSRICDKRDSCICLTACFFLDFVLKILWF